MSASLAVNRGGEARPIGTLAAVHRARRGKRTDQPVRRNSYDVDDKRLVGWWTPQDPMRLDAIVEAAELHELQTKQPGARNGALGYTALRVLKALVGLVDWDTGSLYPSYDEIMRRTRLCRGAVARALARLEKAEFLEWVRRTEPVEEAISSTRSGPRVRQISNAYRLLTPAAWAKRIRARIIQRLRRRKGEEIGAEGATDAEPLAPKDRSLADALVRLQVSVERASASSPRDLNP